MNMLIPENIEVDELKELHREYASIIGIDNLIALCEYTGGTSIYIPTVSDLLKPIVAKKAVNEVKQGIPVKEVVKKYGITERTIYNLLKKNRNINSK